MRRMTDARRTSGETAARLLEVIARADFEVLPGAYVFRPLGDGTTSFRRDALAVVSNADHEHLAAWNFTLPVEFILISEAVRAYKPHRLMFQRALERLGLEAHDVLHVDDSDVDDVGGAKAAGLRVAWVNRNGRSRHPDVRQPDFEIHDLTGLLTLL